MNKEIFKGNWNQLKGTIKQKWGKLTEDDLLQIEGNYDKFEGVMQERYGYSKDELQKQLKDLDGSTKDKAA